MLALTKTGEDPTLMERRMWVMNAMEKIHQGGDKEYGWGHNCFSFVFNREQPEEATLMQWHFS